VAVLNASNAPVWQNEKGVVMKGFVQDIEDLAVKSVEFRRVIYTAKNCQLVLMALKPKEEIGAEVHKLYTLYAPPNHRDGVVHHTRADAEADNEHFDGKTTE
jgi:hypothetical protein